MARQAQIQYVSFYSAGSEARQIDIQPIKKKAGLPKPRRAKRPVVYVDPVAIAGSVVAVVMLVVMLVSLVHFGIVHNRQVELENYVSVLQEKNADLEETYYAGFDPEEIRQIALAKGMIPAEQAQVLRVEMPQPEPEMQESQTLWTFLVDLFA